jgi:hypothetical protein
MLLAPLLMTPSLIISPAVSPLISPVFFPPSQSAARRRVVPIIASQLDYKDPAVAAEFTDVNELAFDEVEGELAMSGIIAPPAMNEMDVRLMLVEMRMRQKGTMPGAEAKPAQKKPAKFANDYEKALWEKPAFKALIENYQGRRDTNSMNLATEYLNNPVRARELYGRTDVYESTVKAIEEALNARFEQKVRSGRISFAGFPAAMGEPAVRMTLEPFGEIVSLEVSDDGITCFGQAEFKTVDSAKAAIEKYDGVDMGLGTLLEITAL